MQVRLIACFALLGALIAGVGAAARERDFRARAFVIRVPPAYGTDAGLAWARGEPVLRRALELAGRDGRQAAWLRRRSSVELTGRRDFAVAVRAPAGPEAAALATAYAKAIKRSLPAEPGLGTRGRGAREAHRPLGPPGWAALGGTAGLWIGAAVAIVRTGSGRARRGASAPCAPATRATPG